MARAARSSVRATAVAVRPAAAIPVARSGASADGAPAGDAPKPVAQGASLLSFEVVEHVVKGA